MLLKTWRRLVSKRPMLKQTLHALYWLPIPIVLVQYFVTFKTVNGRSMQPTLNPDSSTWRDVVLFDRFSIALGRWHREDIVALKSPINPKILLVKRIVALAGDIVTTLPPYPDKEVTIPPGHVWVEGDESFHTEDSNLFGPVPLALIDSKLTYILWPLDRSGPLRRPSLPITKQGVPRGYMWRYEMAEFERAEARKARVKRAPA